MTTLVLGASGATGKQLVEQLLLKESNIKIIVRSLDKIPNSWKSNDNIEIIEASVLQLNNEEINKIVSGCNAVASCLGHNLSWKGVYGQPRKLVTDAVRLICNAIKENAPNNSIKFVLMNTAGNCNRDLKEPLSFKHKLVVSLLRLLLPPHVDNEAAADYLRTEIGQNNSFIEWVAVRPDNLTNSDNVSKYEIYPSPIRDAIFDAGKTSRINVAHFMANLIADDKAWAKWKGQMPVIYNSLSE
ncbi:NAD(P)-dependent oxidoreductase [Tenacibaculum singaporense]|uniref:NAD(P)-dependent oxidoreductase n=1 Tax=Tenacibaculum singaporense TaxID=2358479 RepID=UPI000F6774E1|nr:NAD(P)-binding oxidoreductase [Tenacibaculum singaporense]RSC93651.1 NAD(P)-dependent oxidoreductase [Tenacibaculum singaporense]